MREERHEPAADETPLPPFAEQVAEQIGGWRGVVEAGIPVLAFVVANLVADLRPAIVIAVGVALVIAAVRLWQRKPIRYVVNGVVGVAVGAAIAWNTGQERDFYLPGILISVGYAAAMLASVAVRQPLVGWIWSVVAAGGRSDWRANPRLRRAFGWLTLAWAAVYLGKAGVQAALWDAARYDDGMATALGVARLALGYPPYALLLAGTIWAAGRIMREEQAPDRQQIT